MTSLQTLVGRVRVQIRDNGSTQVFPDVTDYTLATPAVVANNSPELTQFVLDALAEYSTWRPLPRPYALNLVAGTTTYTLPGDWIAPDMRSFEAALHPTRIPDRMQFLPEVNMSGPDPLAGQQFLKFQWYNELQQLVLTAAPITNQTLNFTYFSYHQPSVLTPTAACTVPAEKQAAALMPAYEHALRAIATDQGMKLQKYKIANGSLQIDNSKIADHLIQQADDWRERFRREVVLRPFGAMGDPDPDLW